MRTSDRPLYTRREFLTGSAGIAVAFAFPWARSQGVIPETADEVPVSAWVTLSADDTVVIMSPAAEMGQGSMTAVPMIFAEEMDLDWSRVRIEFSPSDDAIFHNPVPWAHGIMLTLGSSAVAGYFDAVRRYGAQARRVLMQAAAAHWRVEVAELTTAPHRVAHRPSGRSMGYGQAAARLRLPVTLPEIAAQDLKRPQDFRIIGSTLPRYDVPAKAAGAPLFSIDVDLPDMLYATVLRSPVMGGRPARLMNHDTIVARPGMRRLVELPDAVGIIADSYAAALAAEKDLEVEWSTVSAASGLTDQSCFEEHLAAVRDAKLRGLPWQEAGDVAGAFRAAARIHEAEYRTDYLYHAQLEPLNAVARVSEDGRRVEVWAGTQAPTHCARAVAAALNIPVKDVTLHRSMLGGGFGRRGAQDHDWVVDAVRLARAAGKPVKAIWSREADVRAGRLKPVTAQRLRAAEAAGGALVGWHHRTASDEPHRQADPYRYEKNRRWPVIAGLGLDIPYQIDHILCEVLVREMPVRISPLRGVGASLNRFASESFMDEIALAKGRDPLEFRLGLLQHNDAARHVLQTVAEMANWSGRTPEDGLGLAFGTDETLFGVIAQVAVDDTSGVVRVERVWVALDVGVAVHPHNIVGQMEGAVIFAVSNTLKERISLSDGAVVQRNFHDYPILRMNESPDIEVQVIARGERPPSGVGDTGPVIVPAAIANGVAAATGRRLRHLPLTPERVREALRMTPAG